MQCVLDGTDLGIKDTVESISPVLWRHFAVHSEGEGRTNLLPKDLGGVTVSTNDA